ncbi:rhodanese-like domain-containing protein [Uliginosibacterium sp. H3]|uniref:Rhodanese-like domain-containing protein n=1 Tax=Uliginosibacterium silvisoli TaxID=3114758 RepID=A0ABU6K1M1_9RHOO|nr:rhodanese-like domain-containing protein [Uliginosibacterium sp. H3]
MLEQISATDLAAWLKDGSRARPFLLDVREPHEFAHCAIEGAVSMPMGTIPGRTDELDAGRDIVCICHHGMRSQQVAMFLGTRGFDRIFNLSGGIHAWSEQVDPTVPTY